MIILATSGGRMKKPKLTLGELCSRASLFPDLVEALEALLSKNDKKKAKAILDKIKEFDLS